MAKDTSRKPDNPQIKKVRPSNCAACRQTVTGNPCSGIMQRIVNGVSL